MKKTNDGSKAGTKSRLGIIGLGKMGGNLALQATEKGIGIVGKARSIKPELEERGVKVVDNYDSFVSFLKHPRVIYLSLPAGPTVDSVLDELLPLLEKGDVVMDGGNSFYLDSIEREGRLWARGIYFLDCGTSGGLEGARHGACFMVGGRSDGIKIAEPLLKMLAVPEGYLHTGNPGSGHFAKLVQDAINKEVPIPVISQSVMELFKSRMHDSDAYRSIALMRHGFGGHPFGKDDGIIKERKTSRIKKI